MMPRISYLVCGNPRSGTSLLCELLKSTGIAGRPEEYFWRGDVPSWRVRWNVAGTEEYVDAVLRHGTTPNGVFGAKVMATYFEEDVVQVLRTLPGKEDLSVPDLLAAVFPDLRYVHIRRRDRVRQAVSWAKASQTDIWTERVDEPSAAAAQPVFDFPMIDGLVGLIAEGERIWKAYVEENRVTPLDVVYEDLVANRVETIRCVLEYLGVSLPPDFALPSPPLRKQADATSEEWVERYLQLKRPG